DEHRVLHRERDAHRVRGRAPVLAQRLAEPTFVERARSHGTALAPRGMAASAAEHEVDHPVERLPLAHVGALSAYPSFCTSSNMRAVQPAISTGGRSSATMRSAIATSSRPAAESGCASTTGRPASPSVDTAGSIGTAPTSGAPVSAARRFPPPEP